MKTLEQLNLSGKRVFMRVDFNVPLDKQQRVTDDLRVQAVLPSIRKVVDAGGKLILASHLGRPKGKAVPELSLNPVGKYLAEVLGRPVKMAPDCVGEAVQAQRDRGVGRPPGQRLEDGTGARYVDPARFSHRGPPGRLGPPSDPRRRFARPARALPQPRPPCSLPVRRIRTDQPSPCASEAHRPPPAPAKGQPRQ